MTARGSQPRHFQRRVNRTRMHTDAPHDGLHHAQMGRFIRYTNTTACSVVPLVQFADHRLPSPSPCQLGEDLPESEGCAPIGAKPYIILMYHTPCYRALMLPEQFLGRGYTGWFASVFPAEIWSLVRVPAKACPLITTDTVGCLTATN